MYKERPLNMVLPVLPISITWHLGKEAKTIPSAKWLCYGPFKELKPWKSLQIPSKIVEKVTFKK